MDGSVAGSSVSGAGGASVESVASAPSSVGRVRRRSPSSARKLARLLRRKTKILVAFGSCACEGCIPGLANLSKWEEVFETAYGTLTTENPHGVWPQPSVLVPEGELHIPKFYPVLRTLDQVVPVDYYMPGCPPESHQIGAVIDLVIKVLQGQATCFWFEDGVEVAERMGPWDLMCSPAGVLHGFRNESDEPVYIQVLLGEGKPPLPSYDDAALEERKRGRADSLSQPDS